MSENHIFQKTFIWSAPSNIALVKYWGKTGLQRPMNPNLSFTLEKARTWVELKWVPGQFDGKNFEFIFGDVPASEKFRSKLTKAFALWAEVEKLTFPGIPKLRTHNNFPHSAGIASSASSFAALASAFWETQVVIQNREWKTEDSIQASRLARLGSGSACRSLFGRLVSWGKCSDFFMNGSDDFATALDSNIPSTNLQWRDAVILVDQQPKKVSSSAGHELMDHHIFKVSRESQARNNFREIYQCLVEANWPRFIERVEEEALTLHALMMTSRPSVILTQPLSWELIQEIRNFRQSTGLNICFTLDAGPNIHVLYHKDHALEVEVWLQKMATQKSLSLHWDEVGMGPRNEGEHK